MAYSIKALKYMHIDIQVPGCAMFYQDKLDQHVEVVGYLFLIRNGVHNILVDTGIGLPPGEKAPQRQMFGHFCVEPGEDPVSLLSKEGLSPADIDTVILSHLHSNHCWNVDLFPHAEVFFSRHGWEAVLSPRHPALFPDADFPRPKYNYLKERAWDRVRLLEREQEVLPGIYTYWVGGHTPCSHIVVIDSLKGKVILTGDLAFYYANVEENIPVGAFFDLAECFEGMDLVRRLNGLVVPSHDPEILVRHPGGHIA